MLAQSADLRTSLTWERAALNPRCEPSSQLGPQDSKFTLRLLSIAKSLWVFFTFYLYPGAKKYLQEF